MFLFAIVVFGSNKNMGVIVAMFTKFEVYTIKKFTQIETEKQTKKICKFETFQSSYYNYKNEDCGVINNGQNGHLKRKAGTESYRRQLN